SASANRPSLRGPRTAGLSPEVPFPTPCASSGALQALVAAQPTGGSPAEAPARAPGSQSEAPSVSASLPRRPSEVRQEEAEPHSSSVVGRAHSSDNHDTGATGGTDETGKANCWNHDARRVCSGWMGYVIALLVI